MESFDRGSNIIVPILLSSVDAENMPQGLLWLVRSHTYLDWKDYPDDKTEFWKRLKRVLKDPDMEPSACVCGQISPNMRPEQGTT